MSVTASFLNFAGAAGFASHCHARRQSSLVPSATATC